MTLMMEALLPLAADPAPQASMQQLVVQVITVLGASTVLGAIATAWLSRRKTAAEARKTDSESDSVHATAAATLTDSALALIAPMQSEMSRMSARITVLENDQENAREREREYLDELTAYRSWAAAWREWGDKASRLLRDAGIPIDPPPHDWPMPPGRGQKPTKEKR